MADAASKIACPECHHEFRVARAAGWKDGQTFVLELKFEPGASIAASTVSDAIANTEKVIKAVAKNIGVNVQLFIEEIRLDGHELAVRFVEARAKPKIK